MLVRSDYEASIRKRIYQAQPVPFRKVSFRNGDDAQVSECHRNVDRWVEENPGTAAVRGWVTCMDFQIAIRLTAHSVVRDTDGHLFDITPLGNERERSGMNFVAHLGDEQIFCAIKESGIFIDCPCEQDGECLATR